MVFNLLHKESVHLFHLISGKLAYSQPDTDLNFANILFLYSLQVFTSI